ncbi:hypothetical protein FRC17_010851 [Serendipita sp. 399]|nr:hypothetical protein FRC17_010851 [Serendipita sp. 399]
MSTPSTPSKRVRPHSRVPPNVISDTGSSQFGAFTEPRQSPKFSSSLNYGPSSSVKITGKEAQTGRKPPQGPDSNKLPYSPPSLTHPPTYTLPNTHVQHVHRSAQQSYPEFLPLLDTLRYQLSWCFSGLKDALRWDRVVNILISDSEVRSHMIKSFVLNTLGLISIFIFDLIILPLLHRKATPSSITQTTSIYQLFWILPVMGGSLYFNGIWCSTIAEKVYISQYGRQHAASSTSYAGLITAIASSAYRVILIVTSIIVSFALSYIPFFGKWLSFLFICWVDSEQILLFRARGLSLAQRVKYLEERWAYFLGFGLPTTAVCTMGSSLVNVAIFALIFPSFIILAIYANPIPSQPYSPAPPIVSSTTGETVYPLPSPFIPVRFPVFRLVIWINAWVIRGLDFLTSSRRTRNRMDTTNKRWEDDFPDPGMSMNSPLGSSTFSPTSAGLRNRMRVE